MATSTAPAHSIKSVFANTQIHKEKLKELDFFAHAPNK
jgi:hypothetical protein